MTRKFNYQFEILYNKYSPFLISIVIFLYHTIRFLTTLDVEWMEYFFFPSLLTSLHMYNSRQTFMLCKVHRCFVNYVVGNVIACMISHYLINPYMNVWWYATVMFSSIFVMLLAIYYSQSEKKKGERN